MKKTLSLILAGLSAVVLFAGAACAEDWVRIAGAPSFKCFVDRDSVAMKDFDGTNFLTVKVKTTLTAPADSKLAAGKNFDSFTDEWACDPFEKAFFILKTEQFIEGKPVAFAENRFDAAAMTVVPKESTAEIIYDFAMHIFKENRKAKKK